MPLRRRLAIACASAVALAILLAAIVVYVVVRSQLLGQVDNELHSQAALTPQLKCNAGGPPTPTAGGGAPIWQVVNGQAQVLCGDGNVTLPFDSHVQAVANNQAGGYLQDVNHRRDGAEAADRPDQLRQPVRVGAGGPSARPAALPGGERPVRAACGPVPVVRGRDRARRLPRAAGGRARAGAARRGGPDRAAHHRHRGPDQPHPVPRRRRGRAAGHALQRDDRAIAGLASRARRVGAGPAPARGRRLPRAPHSDHEPAHEHRGADGRRRTFRR